MLTTELSTLKNSAIALHALEDQRANYSAFVSQTAAQDRIDAEVLPYRRVLSDAESDELWTMLSKRWGIRGPGYGWFPLSDDPEPPGAITFHQELWEAREGDEGFRCFLAAKNVERCFVLRELGPPNYELESAILDTSYDGSEKFLFASGAWVLYSSHESSLTLVGPLAEFFRELWPDCDQLSYAGPFHTGDLRGSWTGA